MHDSGDEHAESRPPPAPRAWAYATDFATHAVSMMNHYAVAYGAPVYLVGSALVDPAPFDVDIRIPVSKADWIRLFGAPDARPGCAKWDWTRSMLAWGRDHLKQSRRLSRVYMRNIDFQVQRVEALGIRYDGKPRLRLDTIPDEVFLAGLGDP